MPNELVTMLGSWRERAKNIRAFGGMIEDFTECAAELEAVIAKMCDVRQRDCKGTPVNHDRVILDCDVHAVPHDGYFTDWFERGEFPKAESDEAEVTPKTDA